MILSSAVINDSDGASTMQKQMIGFIGGAVLMAALTVIDYHFILKFHWVIYVLSIALLALLFTGLGVTKYGATRWLTAPQIGRFQPSELAKVCMIMFFAWFFEKREDKINKASTVFSAIGLFLIPALLIFFEPDLSTTLTFTVIFIAIFFVSRVSYKWIFGLTLGIVPVGGLLVFDAMQEKPLIFKRYMLNRLFSYLNPDEYAASGLTDQQDRAILAISSGQLNGKGLFSSSFDSVKSGNFLTAENCDFVFAVVGEELGFIGSIAVIALFALLVFLCFRTAARAADLSGRLIAVGAGTFIGLQAFINIGVTCGLLPNTGVVLPFFSAGLTSLWCVFIALGLVMNVSLQRKDPED
ncbi:MAG: FtsW/RodA/SpoVE family cell cycle protein [Lachnospiraceae bacterium]|nr:FtsW/RodA/SpoVE family cell cycle protein [Lachnospiraceae bacterium]